MKKCLLTVFFLTYVVVVKAQDLDFNSQTPIYPNAATSHTYPSVGAPATSVAISTSGSNAEFSGTTQPRPRSNGLQSQVNFSNNSSCVTFTMTFNPGVTNLNFDIIEIDRGSSNGTTPETYNYIDKITLTGSIAGTSVTPTIGNDSQNGNVVSGNVITGSASTTGSSNAIVFPQVNVVNIEYCNGAGSQSNPTSQSVTIGDMSWDTPLPVNLTTFSSVQNLTGIELFWRTAEEVNNEYFEVQRSSDARSFESISRIDGEGTTAAGKEYNFIDEFPFDGVNYYRLMQHDLDGSIHFSKIIAQNFSAEKPIITLFPNPLPRNEPLQIRSRKADFSSIELYSSSGKLIPFNSRVAEEGLKEIEFGSTSSGEVLFLKFYNTEGQVIIKRILVE